MAGWLLLAGWVTCGIFGYAFSFAYFQPEYPDLAARGYYEDMRFGILVSITGPIGLLVILTLNGWRHGMKWR